MGSLYTKFEGDGPLAEAPVTSNKSPNRIRYISYHFAQPSSGSSDEVV